MTRLKVQPIKVHHHLELVAKRDQQVMKMLVKDKHIELVPESGIGNDGFVFCSERSTETTKRWRGILEMMLALVNEAEKVMKEEE